MKEGPRRGSQLLCESISCPHQHSPPTLQQAVPAEPCAMQPSFHVPVPSVGGGVPWLPCNLEGSLMEMPVSLHPMHCAGWVWGPHCGSRAYRELTWPSG